MIYVRNDSMDAAFSFALEWYLLKERPLGDDVAMLWRTRPTLMIGCYQNAAAEVNVALARERDIPVVRRITGGGTIYTDPGGWQFSFLRFGVQRAQIQFHDYMAPIAAALARMGVQATFSDRNDILVDGRKISGNAQYHSSGNLLHHGSLLFDTNLDDMADLLTVRDDKLVSKGIQSVRQRVTNIRSHVPRPMTALEFRDELRASLTENAGEYELTPADVAQVEEIADGKFRAWEWNYGQSPRFQWTRGSRFAGGRLECSLNVAGGVLTECRFQGDFFSPGDIGALERALVGCPHREPDIRRALERAGAQELFDQITIDEILTCMV